MNSFYFLLLSIKVTIEGNKQTSTSCSILYNSQHKVWNMGQFLLERSCEFAIKQCIMWSRNAAFVEKVGQNIYQIIFHMRLLTVNHITIVITYFEGKAAMSGFYL